MLRTRIAKAAAVVALALGSAVLTQAATGATPAAAADAKAQKVVLPSMGWQSMGWQ
ncbi:hypothetical protein [Streptomyces cinnamoneus]|uniref:hypothetical protein n=1 Tax=Streptomyces cinnamoneus TaxID=53446 RepID=UPI0015E35BBD|nr:hypothetical protein [Streptomyces cinnamoneus]